MPSVVLGRDGRGQAVTLGDIERRSGLYILGKPGMGKSALMVNIMRSDIEHGHGVFFLDPHGEAIDDLLKRLPTKESLETALLFDPEDETHSFGINLLSCKDLRSLKERTATYTRAYNVFYKLWEDQFGPWLQLILQNVLWAFIENPEYTLAEVPMFLNYRNEAFRNHIVNNIRYTPAVADFWRYEFFERRERDQQERVDAALTRITTLLTHPYVRHIIGQRQTTIDLSTCIEQPVIILFKLSANLAEDIKKFIGTILVSELLHAIRNRPENKREQLCVFVDEFQNFASSDDFRAVITEGRKFGSAITFCHQERYGQFAENQKLLGATLAAVNKVLFQIIVPDAQELAPEFTNKVEATEKRREADLVISPHPVEDIWDRGYANDAVMEIRNRYFWIVDLLRNNPHQKYFQFQGSQPLQKIDAYRSSADMLREGITVLNHYLFDLQTEGVGSQRTQEVLCNVTQC
jgi:Helicase HerA, central domain